MAKSYLDLVNEVLVRLRENEVGTVTENSYSKLIGKFINDGKAYVEDAWTWNALITPVVVSLAADTREYVLDLNSEAVLVKRPDCDKPMAYDVSAAYGNGETGGFPLFEIPNLEMERRRAEASQVFTRVDQPTLFSIQYNDVLQLRLLEYPTQVRIWNLWFKQPEDVLTVDTDIISIPWRPVVAYAKMLALHERGEETGEPGNLAMVEAQRLLADAISLDLKGRSWLTDAH